MTPADLALADRQLLDADASLGRARAAHDAARLVTDSPIDQTLTEVRRALASLAGAVQTIRDGLETPR